MLARQARHQLAQCIVSRHAAVPLHFQLERALNELYQVAIGIGFFYKTERATGHGTHGHRYVAMATQKQHRHARAQPAGDQCLMHLQARHGLHTHIQNANATRRNG